MAIPEVSKLLTDARKAVRSMDRVVFDLGLELDQCYSKLALLMDTGLPSKERVGGIDEIFNEFHAKIRAYEASITSITNDVRDFCTENGEAPIDPKCLNLLKNIIDTCSNVLQTTKSRQGAVSRDQHP